MHSKKLQINNSLQDTHSELSNLEYVKYIILGFSLFSNFKVVNKNLIIP